MKRNTLLVLLLGLTAPLPACLGFVFGVYSAEPLEATVLDAQTKQPLEGVIVTANWQIEEGTMGGNVPVGQLMVLETVTDKDGVFRFPGWGSKSAPKGHLVVHDPQLLLFKSGYEYRRLLNTFTADYNKGMRRRSEWSGRTIELKPFKGTAEEYAEHVYRLSSDVDSMLDFARGDKDCNWKKTPLMLAALHKMSLHFDAKRTKLRGWRLGQHILRIEDIPRNPVCGSPEVFFRSYLP